MFFSSIEEKQILEIQKKYGYMICVLICLHLVKPIH